jgi:hypothetical protein
MRRLQATDYVVEANDFRNTQVFGGSGNDTAVLQDLASGQSITGRSAWFSLSDGDALTGYGFEQVTAAVRSGQTPNSDVQAVDYLFTKNGF